jgi:hypothetical protein
MKNHTPRVDKLRQEIMREGIRDGLASAAYEGLATALETDLKQMSVWNAELIEALEQLHAAIEEDNGTLDAAMRRAGRHIDEIKGLVPDLREITMHTDAVNRPVLDMSGVKTQPHEKILFRETSY